MESCVLNNDWSSNFFQPQRGVRQGCHLSPYLFILAVEVLAKTFNNNKRIRRFLLGNDEVKIRQYTDDDTTLILDGSEKSPTSASNKNFK